MRNSLFKVRREKIRLFLFINSQASVFQGKKRKKKLKSDKLLRINKEKIIV